MGRILLLVRCQAVRPVPFHGHEFHGHEGKSLLLDQPPCQHSTPPVVLHGAVGRLLEQYVPGGTVTVRTNHGDALRARVVVGADGSAGRVARYVGVLCAQVDLALEVEHVRLDAAAEASGLLGQRLQACGVPVDGSHLDAGDEGGAATEVEQGAREVERAWGAVMSRRQAAPLPSHAVTPHSSARSSGVEPCGCVSHGLLDAEAPELVQLRQRVHGEPGDVQ